MSSEGIFLIEFFCLGKSDPWHRAISQKGVLYSPYAAFDLLRTYQSIPGINKPMNNTRIKDWASIAEIVGTLAVVVSLLFLILSIQQNTRAIEAAEMNNIWDAWREASILPIVNNPEFALIRNKVNESRPLTAPEKIQWHAYQTGRIDIWAQLFDLHAEGIISDEKWRYWDEGYWRSWDSARYEEFWSLDEGAEYHPAFRQYVNSRREAIAEQLR